MSLTTIVGAQVKPLRFGSAGSLGPAAQDIATSYGNLYMVNCLNPNAGTIYLKFYNRSAAALNAALGSALPIFTVPVQGNGWVYLAGDDLPVHFEKWLAVRCTTGFADTDATAPGASPILELFYND